MGLDQYAYRTKQQFSSDVDFNDEINHDEIEEIMYWRKHPYLQGFMTELYYKKGGTELSFSYTTLLLSEYNLLELKELIVTKSLPVSHVVYLRERDDIDDAPRNYCEDEEVYVEDDFEDRIERYEDTSEENYEKDLAFIDKAIQSIKDGYSIYYSSYFC